MIKKTKKSVNRALILSVNRDNAVINQLAWDLVKEDDERIIQNIGSMTKFKVVCYIILATANIFRTGNKIDEIICVSNSPVSIFLLIFGLRFKRKKLLLHDPIPHEGESAIGVVLNLVLYKIINLTKGLEIYVDNIALTRDAQKLFPNGKIKIAKLPYTASIVEARTGSVRKDSNILLFIGRIEPYKGLEQLISIAHDMPPDVEIIIAGRGKLPALILPENVKQLGYVEDGSLNILIQRSLAVVLPYKKATGTQIVPTALALGTSVILSNIVEFDVYSGEGVHRFNKKEEIVHLAQSKLGCERISMTMRSKYKKTYSPKTWKGEIRNET